jgi:AmmeMemoRadiSam system protein A
MLHVDDQKLLLQLSRLALEKAIKEKQQLLYDKKSLPSALLVTGACFVTLKKDGQLRGCIGSLTAHQPLVADVIEHTIQAALSDPRFPPTIESEIPKITIHISVLTPPEALYFSSEQHCIDQLRPGIDGLILADRGHRGTFLPSVWDELPEPKDFLEHLKNKAGFPKNYWSDTLTVHRYQAQYFSENSAD